MKYGPRMMCLCSLGLVGATGYPAVADKEPEWLSPRLGPLTPHVHVNGAVGDSSGEAEELAWSHHDPSREDGSVQGLELGASLRLGHLEGFATYVLTYGAEETWEDEWEEAFLKVRDVPGGFEARGGRMLGRFGEHNARHLHAWNFVDMPLPLSGFLGEHGLWYDGGDVTWLRQGVASTYGATAGYGKAVTHAHEHEAGEEDQHAGEENHEHEHGHGIAYDDEVISGRLFGQLRRDDFHHVEPGLSVAVGDEASGRRLAVYGLDATYTWREKGLEPGGRALVWTTELLYRDVEDGVETSHHHEHEEAEQDHELAHETEEEEAFLAGGGEFGFYTDAVFTLNKRVDFGARFSYVEGDEELGSDERFRISPVATVYLDPYRRAALRTQYNYDDIGHGEKEHTVWVQLGLHWGGAEVR